MLLALFQVARLLISRKLQNQERDDTDLVRLAELLEALMRLLVAPVLVRVQLPGQHIVRPLNLLWRGILQQS